MDYLEKAKIRMEHWMEHNDQHKNEYQDFANQLEEAGHKDSAEHIRKLADLTVQSNDSIKKAIEALNK